MKLHICNCKLKLGDVQFDWLEVGFLGDYDWVEIAFYTMDATIVQLEAKVARRYRLWKLRICDGCDFWCRREDAELLRKQNKIMQCRCECLDSVRKTVKAQHSVTIAQHLERIRDLHNVQEEIDEQKAVLSALMDARKRTSCNQLQQEHVATRLRAV